MKLASFSILFYFTLFLNYCKCVDKENIVVFINGDAENPILKVTDVYTTEGVVIGLELLTLTVTKVIVTIKYYNFMGTSDDQQEIVLTGSRIKISRKPSVNFVHVQLTPDDPINYEVSPSFIRIFFEPFAFDRIITPEEQPAVAKELAISGKFTELTTS